MIGGHTIKAKRKNSPTLGYIPTDPEDHRLSQDVRGCTSWTLNVQDVAEQQVWQTWDNPVVGCRVESGALENEKRQQSVRTQAHTQK